MPQPPQKIPRSRQLNFALTEADLKTLALRSADVEMRLVYYGRLVLLGGGHAVIKAQPAQIDCLAFEQLKRLGNNLDQIARRLDATGAIAPPSLEPLLRDIRAVLNRRPRH